MLKRSEIDFIIANEGADTNRLLLSGNKGGGDIDMSLCVKCILARGKMKIKAPLWYENESLVYPFAVSVEQGSSQTTAILKREIIGEAICKDGKSKYITADLTGGMGIDSFFIAANSEKHYYFERNRELCEATEYNFKQLGAQNIICTNKDITENNCEALKELANKDISLLYIDPARRNKTNSKTIQLQDYEPNLLEILPQMFEVSPLVLVKISPMADIKLNLKLLPQTSRVYVVAVDNECKELLFMLERDFKGEEPQIICKNLSSKGSRQNCITPDKSFTFTLSSEESAIAQLATAVEKYLYEPGKDIMKGGAYKLLTERFQCRKLATSTHLYTSSEKIEDFPGKIFKVEEVMEFNKKAIKDIASRYPAADLTARNFPIDTNALKKLSGIKDGGDHHIFAVTLTNNRKTIIICSK